MIIKLADSTKPAVIDIPLHIDDRGYVYCAMDNLGLEGIKRTYVVENFATGQIRAWHGHRKGATFIHVISGASKLGAVSLKSYDGLRDAGVSITKAIPECKFVTLSARKPQLFYIPAGWANGHMSLEPNTKLLVYSTLSFEEVKADDARIGVELLLDFWKVIPR